MGKPEEQGEFGSLRQTLPTPRHSPIRYTSSSPSSGLSSPVGGFLLHPFFQARDPQTCSACVEQGKVDIDLKADFDQLRRVPLSVAIEPLWPEAIGTTFPLSSAGDPTINMRLLLELTLHIDCQAIGFGNWSSGDPTGVAPDTAPA